MEQALTRIARISSGRVAARHRSERSGVLLSRPAISILSTLRGSGPVRLSLLARLTDLEAPLISREIRDLVDEGYVRRSADPTDGRAGIVELTAEGPAGPPGLPGGHRRDHRRDLLGLVGGRPAATCGSTSSGWPPTSPEGPDADHGRHRSATGDAIERPARAS